MRKKNQSAEKIEDSTIVEEPQFSMEQIAEQSKEKIIEISQRKAEKIQKQDELLDRIIDINQQSLTENVPEQELQFSDVKNKIDELTDQIFDVETMLKRFKDGFDYAQLSLVLERIQQVFNDLETVISQANNEVIKTEARIKLLISSKEKLIAKQQKLKGFWQNLFKSKEQDKTAQSILKAEEDLLQSRNNLYLDKESLATIQREKERLGAKQEKLLIAAQIRNFDSTVVSKLSLIDELLDDDLVMAYEWESMQIVVPTKIENLSSKLETPLTEEEKTKLYNLLERRFRISKDEKPVDKESKLKELDAEIEAMRGRKEADFHFGFDSEREEMKSFLREMTEQYGAVVGSDHKRVCKNWLNLFIRHNIKPELDALTQEIIDKQPTEEVQAEVAKNIKAYIDSTYHTSVNLKHWEDLAIKCEPEAWLGMRKVLLASGEYSAESIKDFEDWYADILIEKNLFSGGSESFAGSTAVSNIAKIEHFQSLPRMYEFCVSHDPSHTTTATIRAMKNLLVKSDQTELAEFLQNLPQQTRNMFEVLIDPNSALNFYGESEGLRFEDFALVEPELTLMKEKLVKDLRKKNWSDQAIREAYNLTGNKFEVLENLKKLVLGLGLNFSEFAQAYFRQLFRDFDPKNADDLKFLDLYCKETGLEKERICLDLGSVIIESPTNKLIASLASPEHGDNVHFCELILTEEAKFPEEVIAKLRKIYLKDEVKKQAKLRQDLVVLSVMISANEKSGILKNIIEVYDFDNPLEVSNLEKVVAYYLYLQRFIEYKELYVDKDSPNLRSIIDEKIMSLMSLKEVEEYLSEIIKSLARSSQISFIQNADKTIWKLVYGEEAVEKFLDVLPTDSQEKRNAFTHNDYDRTTEFFKFMCVGNDKTTLNQENLNIFTQYVQRFGLSKTRLLFDYARNIILFKEQGIDLPYHQEQDGIDSFDKLEEKFKKIKEILFGEEEVSDMANLSNLEVEFLNVMTGKSTHRFDRGRPDMQRIINDWNNDSKSEEIVPKPEEYQSFSLEVQRANVTVDVDVIRNEYEELKMNILEACKDPEDVQGLKARALSIIKQKILEIEQMVDANPENSFIQKQLVNYQTIHQNLGQVNDLDQLLIALLSVEKGFALKNNIDSIVREILIKKVFRMNFSEDTLAQYIGVLEKPISVKGVLGMVNIVNNFIKDHVINLSRNNQEGYWSEEAWQKILATKKNSKLIDVTKVFKTQIDALTKEIKSAKVEDVLEPSLAVQFIPDRGFVGEMSGYLADVCYTAEYPLLKKWPNVVPFKLVYTADDGSKEFLGSVLVFEVTQKNGEKALLVRAFDVPQEEDFNISKCIESFLDAMQDLGKKRGATKVLVPGVNGAISNYLMTVAHIKQYVTDKTAVSLAEEFKFNGESYNLTDNCFVAREIK